MSASVAYWLKASYRAHAPEIAQDGLASNELSDAVRKLVKRWQDRFDEGSDKLAAYFAQSVSKRSDAALKKILKDAGFSVEFKMTRAQRDVLNATVNENVALIRSLPQQYLTNIEGAVMRSVQSGRDLHQLTEELQKQHGIVRRRAAFIALDQNNKASAALSRARMIESGLTEAVWQHSSAGKEPRPTHVAMSGKKYDIEKGMWDSAVGKFVLPGELPRCRCVAKAIVKGFS